VEKAIHGEGLGASRFLILQAFTELRRLASIPESEYDEGQVSAKREFLRERVAQIAESGHKCLVFTNYLATVDLVSRDIEALGLRSLVMTGATVERQDLVRQFQTDQTIKAFVMTVKTGGLGLNLTAADYVFIVDPWWNRSVEAQAIDRTHRIGQKNPVFCYRLIARDTIEEKILLLQERKSNLVSSLIGSDADAFKALDEEDIAYLLG
jgi:SNF2 family DNA or RNA helicase